MNQLTTNQAIFEPATEAQILQALTSLGALPSRTSDSADFDRKTYHKALEGVSRHALAKAVTAVLQGGLKHGFFPSPPELRMMCDRIAGELRRRRQLQHDIARQREENDRLDEFYASKTLESRARVAAMVERFKGTPEDRERDFRSAMEAKYGREAIDAVPDNPKARERMGAVRPMEGE